MLAQLCKVLSHFSWFNRPVVKINWNTIEFMEYFHCSIDGNILSLTDLFLLPGL